VVNAETGKIGLDEIEHRRDGPQAERLQPLLFGRVGIGVAEFRSEHLSDGL
jgi:hypothetical protein